MLSIKYIKYLYFIESIQDLKKATINRHKKNIKFLELHFNINEKPIINIERLKREESRIPTLMSIFKTLLKYVKCLNKDAREYIISYKRNIINQRKKVNKSNLVEKENDILHLLTFQTPIII